MKTKQKLLYKKLHNEALSYADGAEAQAIRKSISGKLHMYDFDNMVLALSEAVEEISNSEEFADDIPKEDLYYEPIRTLLEHWFEPEYPDGWHN
jgi:hypothetical protein